MEKHETLLVVEGVLFIDTTHNKKETTHMVGPGSAFVVAPGFIHSLRAGNEAVTLVEASTPSYDTDSIRIANGK
jgi:D-lyxose ketol-isomerase